MARAAAVQVERLLSVAEVAERRIRFVHVGRHVRIPESAVAEFVAEGVVEPASEPRSRRRRVA
jgi:excisionase family DNA binding protein